MQFVSWIWFWCGNFFWAPLSCSCWSVLMMRCWNCKGRGDGLLKTFLPFFALFCTIVRLEEETRAKWCSESKWPLFKALGSFLSWRKGRMPIWQQFKRTSIVLHVQAYYHAITKVYILSKKIQFKIISDIFGAFWVKIWTKKKAAKNISRKKTKERGKNQKKTYIA